MTHSQNQSLPDNTRFNGIWRIENTRSSWSDGKFPDHMKLDLFLKFPENLIWYHSENSTLSTQPVMTLDFKTDLNGTPGLTSGNARFNKVRARQLSATEFEILEMLDEDVIVAAYWRFSEDAQTLWRWGVGKSPAGLSRSYEELFIKESTATHIFDE